MRKAPMPERVEPGCCRWCALPIVQGRRARSWHPECVDAFMAHNRLDVQRRIVVKRDGERCWECGAAPMKWLRERQETFCIYSVEYARKHPELWAPIRKRWGQMTPEERRLGAYCRVERASALELDHTTPLWSVQHLPPMERRPFYGPDNLRLLCPDHHKAKTSREAAERAAIRRAYAELFARQRRPGWDTWGNLVDKFTPDEGTTA